MLRRSLLVCLLSSLKELTYALTILDLNGLQASVRTAIALVSVLSPMILLRLEARYL